jgi:hypothetical protein
LTQKGGCAISDELGHAATGAAMTDEITEPMQITPDITLIDGAVLWLNRTIQASGIQLAIQVSDYVLDSFFGGDMTSLSSKDPQKTASFRALCAREDLQMGASTLHRLVRIGQQARHLPADISERLSLGHHRALLSVDNAAHKQHMAREALRHSWSAEKLAATLAAEHPQSPHRPGRPKKPALLKWLGSVRREVAVCQDARKFAKEFTALPTADQAIAKAELLAVRHRLDDLLATLEP